MFVPKQDLAISINQAVCTYVECNAGVAEPVQHTGNTKVINSKGQYCNGNLHVMKAQENK